MLKYLIGAVAGGLVGYFLLYRLIGCSGGTCPMTSNPYISTVIGILMGMLLAGSFGPSANKNEAESTSKIADTQAGEAGQNSPTEYKRIRAEQAMARIDSGDEVIILDVRTKEEYDAGHIPNAILLPNESIGNERPKLLPDLDAEILIYCRSGNRSEQAARKLIALGYTNVYDFGGLNTWKYEIVKD